MSVSVESSGPIATVTLNRRERRNAVVAAEGLAGVERFADGTGRHGKPAP